MKQMLEESKLESETETSAVTITDQEIQTRLAKLRDLDPGNVRACPKLSLSLMRGTARSKIEAISKITTLN